MNLMAGYIPTLTAPSIMRLDSAPTPCAKILQRRKMRCRRGCDENKLVDFVFADSIR